MHQTYSVTKESRAASLTTALRSAQTHLRFTKGMATAAQDLEKKADKKAKADNK